ncbi:MAG: hypothetical protein E5X33_27005 [Mesorhizobium sp.]|uniref:AbiJ-related protein n=1 Tax=Mesorhizobium sp. TaxID=1871066 RepID=UPI001204F929|nr:hypothetical protein [Mesorhizobium sp.]TIR17096.1 MAG: hypothetical protein E5X33_27005 [Mesorhizobium sp.]
MHSPQQGTENTISEVTRRTIIDHFTVAQVSWAGRLHDDEFLARLYDLTKLPSSDHRYKDAAGDIYQHMVRNSDWDAGWVFYDRRFNLLHAPEAKLLQFLCETLHPVVRPDEGEVLALLEVYNTALAADGWQIVAARLISGRPVYAAQAALRVAIFEEPTGWQKVDRQLQEMRARLDAAGSEEQYQAVGLLCREVLISVAQEVYDPSRHAPIDDKTPSDTDAKRMLEAIFEEELKGSSNEEARAHAKAAVRLALALQHKRLADFRTAALCAVVRGEHAGDHRRPARAPRYDFLGRATQRRSTMTWRRLEAPGSVSRGVTEITATFRSGSPRCGASITPDRTVRPRSSSSATHFKMSLWRSRRPRPDGDVSSKDTC